MVQKETHTRGYIFILCVAILVRSMIHCAKIQNRRIYTQIHTGERERNVASLPLLDAVQKMGKKKTVAKEGVHTKCSTTALCKYIIIFLRCAVLLRALCEWGLRFYVSQTTGRIVDTATQERSRNASLSIGFLSFEMCSPEQQVENSLNVNNKKDVPFQLNQVYLFSCETQFLSLFFFALKKVCSFVIQKNRKVTWKIVSSISHTRSWLCHSFYDVLGHKFCALNLRPNSHRTRDETRTQI